MARRSKTYVELGGVDELRQAFARLEFAALGRAKAVVADSAADMEREAKARCPVSEPQTKSATQPPSGTTRASIKTIIRDAGLSATVGSGYFVARYLEQGTRKMAARPFVNPAFQLVRPRFLAALAAALNRAGNEASVG